MIISPEALKDLEHIIYSVITYTGFENSGIRLYNDINAKFESIAFMPRAIGRMRDDGSREAFVRGYRIVYREFNDHIQIGAIIHSSRLYPRPEQ